MVFSRIERHSRALARLVPALAAVLVMSVAAQPAVAAARPADAELVRAAEHGDARAQYRLGMMHLSGEVASSTTLEAARWFRRAADQGLPEAQRIVGNMHAEGIGLPQDDAATIRWYRLAAEQGDAVAQYYLGHLFVYSSANRDLPESIRWYRLAAAQGYVRAQLELAYMYKHGIGVGQDLVKAYTWNAAAVSRLEYIQVSAGGADKIYYKAYGLAYKGPSPVPHAGELLQDAADKLTPEQLAAGKAAAERCQNSRYQDCD